MTSPPSTHREERRRALRWLSAWGAGALAGCGGGGGGSEPAAPPATPPTTNPPVITPPVTTPPVTPPAPIVTAEGVTLHALPATPQWAADTHGKLGTAAVVANLPRVFAAQRLQRLDLVINNVNWQLMQRNLASLRSRLVDTAISALPDPVAVPCSVFHQGVEWYQVGVRFKGNTSLYGANSNKLPLKLKFNQFEDAYPAIVGQRFFGFKELHLKSGFRDESSLHEQLADDLFRNFGVASPHASFYEVHIDVGDGTGPRFWGVYTAVEDVEDTVLKTQLGNNSGNLYKPEDDAATFAAGSFNATLNVSQLALKTNTTGATYADVQALLAATNDSARLASNPAQWRAALEAVFDVPTFLKWLAANTVMQNWDSYGVQARNYYLYANADNGGRLTWIPWDNNEAMAANNRALPLSLGSVGTGWPLIHYLMKEPTYLALYKAQVAAFARNHYNSAALDAVIDARASLIASAIGNEVAGYTYTSPARFADAVAAMKAQVASRQAAALAFAG